MTDNDFWTMQELGKHSKAFVETAKKLPKKKGNKHYKVGYALERDVKIALEQDGYTVFRSAGSHSQADLIAIRTDEWLQPNDSSITKYPFVQFSTMQETQKPNDQKRTERIL